MDQLSQTYTASFRQIFFSGYLKKIITWFLGGICVPLVIVPIIFKFYLDPLANTKQNFRNQVIDLKILVRKTFYRNEEIVRFCNENKKLVKNFQYHAELNDITQRRDAVFEELIYFVAKMYDQNHLSLDSYRVIKEFTRWNNDLFYSHQNICSLPLKSPKTLQNWREKIIKIIDENH